MVVYGGALNTDFDISILLYYYRSSHPFSLNLFASHSLIKITISYNNPHNDTHIHQSNTIKSQVLPTYSGKAGDGEPLLESLIWLLLTSEVPTKEQVDSLTKELHERSAMLPSHVIPLLNTLPKDMHPMTQFSIGLNAAQTASVFAKAYGECYRY